MIYLLFKPHKFNPKLSVLLASTLLTTACIPHQQIPDSQRIQCLQQLAAKDNFSATPGTLYTGVHDPLERARLNAHFRKSAQQLTNAIQAHAEHQALLKIFGDEINQVDREQLDTEDASQVALTYEKALDCLGFESSEGILNRWMYGEEIMKLIN